MAGIEKICEGTHSLLEFRLEMLKYAVEKSDGISFGTTFTVLSLSQKYQLSRDIDKEFISVDTYNEQHKKLTRRHTIKTVKEGP